jgi:hypothetical protein
MLLVKGLGGTKIYDYKFVFMIFGIMMVLSVGIFVLFNFDIVRYIVIGLYVAAILAVAVKYRREIFSLIRK